MILKSGSMPESILGLEKWLLLFDCFNGKTTITQNGKTLLKIFREEETVHLSVFEDGGQTASQDFAQGLQLNLHHDFHLNLHFNLQQQLLLTSDGMRLAIFIDGKLSGEHFFFSPLTFLEAEVITDTPFHFEEGYVYQDNEDAKRKNAFTSGTLLPSYRAKTFSPKVLTIGAHTHYFCLQGVDGEAFAVKLLHFVSKDGASYDEYTPLQVENSSMRIGCYTLCVLNETDKALDETEKEIAVFYLLHKEKTSLCTCAFFGDKGVRKTSLALDFAGVDLSLVRALDLTKENEMYHMYLKTDGGTIIFTSYDLLHWEKH